MLCVAVVIMFTTQHKKNIHCNYCFTPHWHSQFIYNTQSYPIIENTRVHIIIQHGKSPGRAMWYRLPGSGSVAGLRASAHRAAVTPRTSNDHYKMGTIKTGDRIAWAKKQQETVPNFRYRMNVAWN